MKQHFYRLIRYIRPYGWTVAAIIFLGVVISACTATFAYIIRPLIDEALTAKNKNMLTMLPLFMLGVFFIKAASGYLASVATQSMGFRVLMDIRNDLYRAILRLPVGHFTNTSSGEIISRMINDVNVLQRTISTVVKDLIQHSVTTIFLIGVVVYQDPYLAVIALGVLPLAFYPLVALGKRLRKRSQKGQEAISGLTQVLTETIGGIRVVKAFCAEGREETRFKNANTHYRKNMVKIIRIAEIPSPMMEFIGAIGVVGIIWYGGSRVVSGEITPGALLSFIVACLTMYGPIRSLSVANATIQISLAAAARIFEVMDTPSEEPEGENKIALSGVKESITFDAVSHTYEGGDDAAVEQVSFSAGVGDVIALVGPSGAGKSTLVNLLTRFIEPTHGTVRIDGVDYRDYSLNSLRRIIAVVGQDTVLFDDTLAANIAYGAGEGSVSRKQVTDAAKRAHAHDFIMALPNGYDTRAGERGVMLSGGQRQRIAIARAILRDAPILILDEATSALDSESERHVQEALADLMADRTTFVIAHRLATVRHATRILVMEGGRIVEQGTHDQLLRGRGLYKKLHDLQFKTAAQGAG